LRHGRLLRSDRPMRKRLAAGTRERTLTTLCELISNDVRRWARIIKDTAIWYR